MISCASALARPAGAQGIPRWTAEVSVGAGSHSRQAGTVYFFDDLTSTAWLAVSRSAALTPTSALYAQLELSPDLTLGESVCIPAPNGTCTARFGDHGGGAVTAGLRIALHPRVVLGAGAGVQRSSRLWRSILDSELSLSLTQHVALRAGVRYERGDGVWFAPVTVGARAFW